MHSDLLEIDRMRVLLAIALLGFGIAGVGAARAADLPAGRPSKPAKTFRRSWSNAWAVEHLYAASAQSLATQGDSQADTQPDTQSNTRHRPHAHGSHRMRFR